MSAAIATAIGSAAYGHRLHPRQDVSGLVGCFCRRRRLRRRGADGTCGHGGGWHPVDPFRAEAAVDRSGAAQGDHGDLVCLLLRHAVAYHRPAVRHPVRHPVLTVCPRLGLWRRLLNRLILAWRQACGDTPEPSAVILDSRSCQSAPSCFGRGFDGGKKIKGSIVEAPRSMIHLAVDKYGFPLAITVSPANVHDSKGIVPVLHQLAGRGFKGTALGDLSYRGQRLSKAGEALGITIQPSAGGHGGTFIPEGIRWVVERSLAWISRYRRLNTIFERTEGHLVAFIEIAFISILSRRLVRLVTQEISA